MDSNKKINPANLIIAAAITAIHAKISRMEEEFNREFRDKITQKDVDGLPMWARKRMEIAMMMILDTYGAILMDISNRNEPSMSSHQSQSH